MSQLTQQIEALTQIRKLIERHFPDCMFYHVEQELRGYIELKSYESVVFDDKNERYRLETLALCRVCETPSALAEIPTRTGSFFLCGTCRRDIAVKETP